MQIALAVDLNANGKRDAGEPVVIQASEPFQDVGLDGLPDQKSPATIRFATPILRATTTTT